MVDLTTPASKPCRKMKRPLWMGEFNGALSVPGKGSFSGCYQGMSCGMNFTRGKLQLFRKKQNWMVQFDPDGPLSPFQRALSSNFNIQGYLRERSFYKNFVQHGKVQIHFGHSAFLQFDFENLERDEEMLKKISDVFEYFFSKDESYSPAVQDASSAEEDPFSKAEESHLERNKLIAQSTLCKNLSKRELESPPTYDTSPKSFSSPEIESVGDDDEPKDKEMEIDDLNSCGYFSNEYISDLLQESHPKSPEHDKNGAQNGLTTPKKDPSWMNIPPVKVNGILSPSSKNNIIKTTTPFANGLSSGKPQKFLTSDQCRNAKDSVKRSLNKSNVSNSGSSLRPATPILSQTKPVNFYGASRSAPRRRNYENIGLDQSPYFNNSQRQGRGYARLSTGTAAPKRDYGSCQSAVCVNGNAKKLRLARERDEKENGYCDNQGFVNIHNSCYMNAILQALLSFPVLISHLSNEKYMQIDDGLLMAFLELNQIRFQTLNGRKTCLLNTFKEKMIKASNNFKEMGRHEDAHEYYLSFKDCLQQEIQQVIPNDQAIEDITNLEMVETRLCMTCSKHSKNVNETTQTHSELGVDIPEEMNLDENFRLKCLIDSTLKSSTVPFNCECGETYVDLFKRFSRLPKILVIHLHRYSVKDGNIEKNSSHIDIPEVLDLTRFCTKNVSAPLLEKRSDFISYDVDDANEEKCKYQLQAVIEHLGSWANGGHYIARVRHAGVWLKCDDEVVSQMSEEVADSCQQSAYLLFYSHSSQTQMNEIG